MASRVVRARLDDASERGLSALMREGRNESEAVRAALVEAGGRRPRAAPPAGEGGPPRGAPRGGGGVPPRGGPPRRHRRASGRHGGHGCGGGRLARVTRGDVY